ncbi:MAG: RNA 2',3'-cyclic phosphodiesterase [Coriobacteriaceae bacterium]|nr:RNA 2',3'-cyclic phosphodiesterase [Coriobacteriaceae bacterium]
MRAFVAIDLDPGALDVLAEARRAFLHGAPSWAGEKWVEEHNLHITLAFLGSVDEAVSRALVSALVAAGARHEAFHLDPAGLRAVPALRRATMLWACYAQAPAAEALSADLRTAALTFAPETAVRPFTAHVTLVRSRRPRPVPAGALQAADEAVSTRLSVLSVPSVTLYSSTLTRHGPEYECVAALPLRRA